MPGVRRDAETQCGRLLRVLLLWLGAMPIDSGRSGRWSLGEQLLLMLDSNEIGTKRRDLVRKPITATILWCIPIALGAAASIAVSSSRIIAATWAVAFTWMGVGCLLNARRCNRLHCYFSGPILLLGAMAVGLLASGVISLRPHAISNTISITLALALLSFVPETIWGRYRRR